MVFFCYVEVGESREHQGVVVLQLRKLVLKSHDLETLSADLASVDRTFSDHVEHLFMSVCIVFNTRTHANNNSPRTVRGKYKDGVVYSSKLGMDN
jgi:hypothetical protein